MISFLLRAVLLGSTFGVAWVLAERVDILPAPLRRTLSESFVTVSHQLSAVAAGHLVWETGHRRQRRLDQGAPALAEPTDDGVAAPMVAGLYVATDATNARSSPSTSSLRVGVIPAGTNLMVSERSADGAWYRISWGGSSAYAAADLLRPVHPPELRRVDTLLAEAEILIRSAALPQARDRLDMARSDLESLVVVPGAAKRTARLELLSGTLYLALGLDREADTSLARALSADPALELDPETSPRKLRRRVSRLRLGFESSALN